MGVVGGRSTVGWGGWVGRRRTVVSRVESNRSIIVIKMVMMRMMMIVGSRFACVKPNVVVIIITFVFPINIINIFVVVVIAVVGIILVGAIDILSSTWFALKASHFPWQFGRLTFYYGIRIIGPGG